MWSVCLTYSVNPQTVVFYFSTCLSSILLLVLSRLNVATKASKQIFGQSDYNWDLCFNLVQSLLWKGVWCSSNNQNIWLLINICCFYYCCCHCDIKTPKAQIPEANITDAWTRAPSLNRERQEGNREPGCPVPSTPTLSLRNLAWPDGGQKITPFYVSPPRGAFILSLLILRLYSWNLNVLLYGICQFPW